MAGWLVALNLLSTFAMTGVIWFVQLVHYPLLSAVPSGDFPWFAQQYQSRTGWVVIPLMLIELVTSYWLAIVPSTMHSLFITGAICTSIVWICTLAVQTPLHSLLKRGYTSTRHRRLVQTNWVRTLFWTLHTVVLLVVVTTL